MKKALIAIAAIAALSACSNNEAKLKRSIVECMASAEIMNVDNDEWSVMKIHSQIMQTQFHFDLTFEEEKSLKAQILKDWNIESLPEAERSEKAKTVFDSPACKAMRS